MHCTIGDVESVLEELYEKEEYINDSEEILELDEESIIVTDGFEIEIPYLNLAVKEGVMYVKREGRFEPDFALTILYELDEDLSSYLYYEEDSIAMTLHNYLQYMGVKKSVIDIPCIINIEKR